jgi:hypothetical protein
MTTLPWAQGTTPAPSAPTVVMASRLELRRRRDVPAFLIASLRLRRAFRHAPGSVGLGLAAQPWSRTFWTLSTWASQADLRAYSASPLHRQIMRRFRPAMAGSTFVEWTSVEGAAPSWDEARERLAATGARYSTPTVRPGS